MINLNPHLRQHLPQENTFDWLLNCEGTVHRHVKHRRTVALTVGGRRYFIKIHRGCGWREIFKDLFQGRAPIVSARPEWEAIAVVRELGIPTVTVAGTGERGHNPAQRESFVITEALEGMLMLEDLTRDWGGLTGRRQQQLKRAVLDELARITRTMHGAGLNHRDYYLGHILVRDRDWTTWQPADELKLFVIDLHRMQRRRRVPTRWRVKDLGGLLFSALDCGLTRRDVLRFIHLYREVPARKHRFWRRVWRNAVRLYISFHHRPPPGIF